VEFKTFVHATEPTGWFRVTGLREEIKPRLVPPPYGLPDTSSQGGNSGPGGNDLRRLAYPPPVISERGNSIMYRQECEGGFSYTVGVIWNIEEDNILTGNWSIFPSDFQPFVLTPKQTGVVQLGRRSSFDQELKSHAVWWQRYWQQCTIQLPDSILEAQWYRELYKFGSASRRGAPPITLQAVWTADNGRLPPWKGDFHHDLNTQLSYWPAYSSNHLEEESAFLDWLWWCKPVAERYTNTYFGTTGLNLAGVSTLTGEPMGGWIQYSLSPTVSAWLSHHFYLHWRYSLDKEFLCERAYPWIRAVAIHLDELSVRDEKGKRKLPLSSSPEINDNRVDAWFREITNYDLALVRWLFGAAAELASELGIKDEAGRWTLIQSEWPELATASEGGKLLVAPGVELKESHRHFSHLMAIHPLGLLNWERGASDRNTIAASLSDLERLGPDLWCGYSYAWLGSMWARARNGEKAAEALRIFSTCFCLPNSFHVNGDQSGTGKSKFTYRPFTLEGNFAFAAGIQEMLLQSHGGVVRVFPAVPTSWGDVSFATMRAEGALLVSAVRKAGKTKSVRIVSEMGGRVVLADPFAGGKFTSRGKRVTMLPARGGMIEFTAVPGAEVEFVSQ
jgi:alpha-L-fucosidase 2